MNRYPPISITTEGVEPPLIDVTVSIYATRSELHRLAEWLHAEGYDLAAEIDEWLETHPEENHQ